MVNKELSDFNCLTESETRILEAAEKEFMLKGFAGSRTTSIAEAAGVTHAMLHYYFRTKEKLFIRIISEKIEILKDLIVRSFENMDLPLNEIIRSLINMHLDFISRNPDLPRFLITEVFSNPELLASFSEKIKEVSPGILSKLQRKIDELAREGKCRRVDAKMLMLDIVSLNAFPYLAAPLVNCVLDNCMADNAEFLEMRKRENYITIMQKLMPIDLSERALVNP